MVKAPLQLPKFPLLLPDEKEFVYESCTPLSSSSGSIEGSFAFVSGRVFFTQLASLTCPAELEDNQVQVIF
ncbi:F-box protein SKIP16 [Camellia lanceoleosa]|uniref:F-box protein SKIP16 n=1 Tax=Camellia lanceoleosa TaxID=1840588 RepID=A0ACC0GWA7_9ERIC|nr:F-box protein SKIP16 [Camellia lanceoleosa]